MKQPLPVFMYVLLPAIALVFSCSEQRLIPDREKEKVEIASVIDSAIGWFKTKDYALLYTVFSQDTNFIEVRPDSVIVKGFDQFKENLEKFRNPDFQYLRHEIRDLKITLSQRGDTAWFVCMLDDFITWKGQRIGWDNARWTGTIEKRDGRWVIVQQHFSFPAE